LVNDRFSNLAAFSEAALSSGVIRIETGIFVGIRFAKQMYIVTIYTVRQAFRFKFFGSKRLKRLHAVIDMAAEVWNHAVALKNRYYRLFGRTLPKAKLQAHLAKLRRTRFPRWKAVGSQSVQDITDRLYQAWEAFFKGDIKRPPTFKKRRKYHSFTLKQTGYKLLGEGRIEILGKTYRFNQSRRIEGRIKTVNIRRDAVGDVFLSFSCDEVPQPEPLPETGQSAGADFGLKTFVTLSTGQKVESPQPLKAALRAIRKAHRDLSRTQKGSKGRKKARQAVARVHRAVADLRDDWQWKLARTLVERFDALAFETLSLEGMRRLWGRKVSDLGFGDFLQKVEWLAGKLGRTFVKIDRFEPTTQTCHACGHRQGMPLEVRTFVCEACGRTEDRDLNAAKNILEAGRGLRTGAGRKTAARRLPALVTAEFHGL
jgi:putative transposase